MNYSIFSSIQNNDLKSLEFYVFSKKNINILDENGFSLLYWATRTNQLSAMKLLIDNKADIDFQDFQGNLLILHLLKKLKFNERFK